MTTVKDHILPNDQPIVDLECETAFNALTDKEKLYAHYLSQAAWAGSFITALQTSPESPLILELLLRVVSTQSIEDFKKSALNVVSESDFTAFLVYTSGIFANCGNYKGFGDIKIVPNLTEDAFSKILKVSEAYKTKPGPIDLAWNACKTSMYSLKENEKYLGFWNKGVTTYFSSNCTEEDSVIVNAYLKKINMEAYNCRTFKTPNSGDGKKTYEIKLASVLNGFDASFMPARETFQGDDFHVTRGDYSPVLKIVIDNLSKAKVMF
uniref:Dipeptidyl peptidase 3 n=1 Tax=Clastoptera arizonana TaxID=38151 RepID=A0A1B6CRG2_9HEMI